MLSPVFGFRPVRALRAETANVPKPEMFTLSPFRSAATMSSKIVLMTRSAWPLGRSSLLATDSIRSALVMGPPLFPARASALYQPTCGLSMRDDVGCVGGNRCRKGRLLRRFGCSPLPLLPAVRILEQKGLPQDLIHVLDQLDLDRLQDDRRDVADVLLVLHRDQHLLDPAAVGREHLFLEASDREHVSTQGDLAGHREIVSNGDTRQRGDERGRHGDARRRSILGDRTFRNVDVDVDLLVEVALEAELL